jgi:hypothetical protein
MKQTRFIGAVILALALAPLHVVEAQVLGNPTIPSKAPDAAQKARDGIKSFMMAQCKIFEAMKSPGKASNEVVDSARKDFDAAAKHFVDAANSLAKNDFELAVPAGDKDVTTALAALNAAGYSAPKTLAGILRTLAQVSTTASKDLAGAKYNEPERSRVSTLRSLLAVSIRAGEQYIALVALSAQSKS